MKRKIFILLHLQFVIVTGLFCQNPELEITESFKEAQNKNTRTNIGVPGENYWQNSADYEIMATLVPEKRMLQGEETITYYNNSPHKMGKLVLKLYQNLYKKGVARDFNVSPKDVHEGIDILFSEETEERLLDTVIEDGTNLYLHLKDSLSPNDSIRIGLKWEFQIPANSDVRMGAMDDSAFFIGFWYPRVATYDDLNGWDLSKHTGNQEFYHDKGDYKVYIAVPAGYFVMATGELQNPDVVLKDKQLERYKKAQKSDSIISIIREDDLKNIQSVFKKNVWIFHAENVPDFAFGASNHHLWDATSVLIDTASDERVLIQSGYKPESKDFKEVAKFSRKALKYLSFEFPGYPYPFPTVNVFNGTNGTSGMEYPMIANNPSAERRGRTLDVTAHEITHNYLPFYVLTNETQRAWMDEAFAAMLPYKLQERIEPTLNRLTRYTKNVSKLSNTEEHISTMTSSSAISSRIPYYFTNYTKPALALYYLEEIMGTEMFEKILLEYLTVWQGKHPSAYDFFNLVNESSGKNLNWFWKPWFFEPAWPDLSILNVEEDLNTYKITIKKKGKLPVPVRLKVVFTDGSDYELTKSAEVWRRGENHLVVPIKTNKKISRIVLGNDYIPDVNKNDNVYSITQ
jgi:hypothetical protein